MTTEATRLYNEASDKVKEIVDLYLALDETEKIFFDNLLGISTDTAE